MIFFFVYSLRNSLMLSVKAREAANAVYLYFLIL